jgi:hypothetical protein
MISSRISSTPWRSQTSQIFLEYPATGSTPPLVAPTTVSATNAITRSGPAA